VHPALLAEGLSQAMWTTVVGLLISAPSLVCAQLFKIAAAKRIAALTRLFDELALHHDETAAAGAVVGLRTDRRVRA
jgi:biopolymer transport protein ExbB/TolQ